MFNGSTNHMDKAIYSGQVGTVDFHAKDFVLVNGAPVDTYGMVYVRIKGKGKRKVDCVSFTPESLEII